MGVFLKYYGRDYIIIDKSSEVASFFEVFPRSRALLSHNRRFTGQNNSEYALRHDWNSLLGPPNDQASPRMTDFSEKFMPDAAELLTYLKAFADHHKLKLLLNTEVTKVYRYSLGEKPEGFRLSTSADKAITCNYLVVSISNAKPHIPPIDGIEHTVGYESFSTNYSSYTDKRVLILGLGNAAFETAKQLLNYASHVHVIGRSKELRLSAFTHYIGDIRAVNLQLMDNFLLKNQDHIDLGVELLHSKISKDESTGLLTWNADPKRPFKTMHYRRPYHYIIRCLGWEFDDSIFSEEVKPRHGRSFPETSIIFESSNVPGLFFAGRLLHGVDYRKSTGGVIHGYRYLTRYVAKMMMLKHHGIPLQSSQIDATPSGIADAFFERLVTNSALLSLFSTLCDVITWEEGSETATYYEELLCNAFVLAGDSASLKKRHWLTLEVSWADTNKNDWNEVVINYPGQAHWTRVLHPIIKYYRYLPDRTDEYGIRKVAEYHTMEDADQTFDYKPIWHQPMQDFIQRMFNADYRTQEELLRARQDELFQEFSSRSDLPQTKINIWDPFYGRFSFFPPGVDPTPLTRSQIVSPDRVSDAPASIAQDVRDAAARWAKKSSQQSPPKPEHHKDKGEQERQDQRQQNRRSFVIESVGVLDKHIINQPMQGDEQCFSSHDNLQQN